MTQFIVYELSKIHKSENDSIGGDVYFQEYQNPLATFKNIRCPSETLDWDLIRFTHEECSQLPTLFCDLIARVIKSFRF